MSSYVYAGAHPPSEESWGSRRDGDQAAAPASFPHDNDMAAAVSKATKVEEVRGAGQVEHPVPVSPPPSSSGVETGRGDESRRPPPAGKLAAMSGNIEQPAGDRASGNLSRGSSGTQGDGDGDGDDDDDDDSQAISAAALLLLAASATAQSRLPVAFGAAGGGTSVREQIGFPVCAGVHRENNLRRDHYL